jgi:guanylate kinase
MGRILVLTGPSGSGKTTIARELTRSGNGFVMVTSLTTRPLRTTDIPGEYQRMSKVEILKQSTEGRLLWLESYGNNYYGTPRKFVSDVVHGPKGVVGLMILVPSVLPKLLGFLRLLGQESALSMVFIKVPESTRKGRLRFRGDLSTAEIAKRIEQEIGWMVTWSDTISSLPAKASFDLVNNEGALKDTVAEIRKIVRV